MNRSYHDTIEMQFGLFYFSNYEIDNNHKYKFLLETVQYADEHHFTSVWLPERHFHDFGGNFPNPSVLGAALATITNNIDIRSGSVVLPLHDTIRVAEEWSVVDNLSNGRVGLSIASGWHIDDFVLKPENYENRHALMYREIEELKKLWKGEKITRTNSIGKQVELNIYPEPIQQDIPIWITTGGNEESFRSAGEIGANILTMLLHQDVNKLQKNIKVYKEALRRNGHSAKNAEVALMLHTYVGEDIQEVKKVVEKPFKDYLYSNLSLMENLMLSTASFTGESLEELKKNNLDDVLQFAFERYWDKAALFGTKESCKKLLKTLHDVGVTEIACLVDFGIAQDKITEGLAYLSELQEDFRRQEKGEGTEDLEKDYHNDVDLSEALDNMIDFMADF